MAAQAVESWTDARLDVTSNMVAWYDVSRQMVVRGVHGLSPLHSRQDFAEIIFDGSGFKRDLTQPVFDARPGYRVWRSSSLYFDGKNDWLGANTRGLKLKR